MRREARISKLGWLSATLLGLVTGCNAANEPGPAAPAAADSAAGDSANANFVSREGVNVEFALRPIRLEKTGPAVAGDWADITFRVTDASTGEPIKGRYPAAWMDLGKAWEATGGRPMTCRDRVATYLQGIVGVRPMIDLNSHFLLVLNRDASISVIDPAIGITGITNLFAQINLSRPGADWVLSDDHKRLYVSMPVAGKVALADTTAFKVTHEIEAGENPTRVEIQADQRYLWVSNTTDDPATSGVTIIDTADLKPKTFIATGPGHHEIAFTDDNRHAFVSNRDGGTVSVIDVQKLEKVKDIKTGSRPMSVEFSTLGKAIYVTDVDTGLITVIDPGKLEIRSTIKARPGIGPLRFTNDGRYGIVINSSADEVSVIDGATNVLRHTIQVGDKPYEVNFTTSFAYVRSLDTEDVGLIPISELDEPTPPPVTYIQAGQRPPGTVGDISIADSIIPAVKQAAAAYIVNQAEGTVSYYMEGMGAPMGSFRNYGHATRAIEIVDRSMSEIEPGLYRGRVKIPVEGDYDVAFMMDTPQFLHCFSTMVEPDPNKEPPKGLTVEYEQSSRFVNVGEPRTVRFILRNAADGKPIDDPGDVSVMYYRSDGRGQTTVPAASVGEGAFEVTLEFDTAASYYVFIGSKSHGLRYNDLPYYSLIVVPGN